jgi:hypothetical protein
MPEPAIRLCQAQPSRSRPLQHVQLMAQREDLEMQSDTWSHHSSEYRQNGNQHGRHRDESLSVTVGKCNCTKAYEVFRNHKYWFGLWSLCKT